MMKNIYKGPKYYEETDKDIFFGRDKETQELYYLVENSDFCVCYAESGEGKSSLINAGLSPRLRENDFLPVRIILSDDKFNADLSIEDFYNLVLEAIKLSVKKENDKEDETKRFRYISYFSPESDESLSEGLGWKLRNIELRGDSFHKITPVIIFDQFEEVFSKAKDINWTNNFFSWLEKLYDDAYHSPSANQQKQFKVLLSMRSDYISELDYWSMAKYFMPSLKNNRYCLRPLTIKSANEISKMLPAEKLHDLSYESVVEYAKIEKAKNITDKDVPCVSAFVLSLLLTSLNEKVQRTAQIEHFEKNDDFFFGLINQYYESSLNQSGITSNEERDLLEDMLVDDNGVRKRMPKKSFSFISEDKINQLARNRIINVINDYIELTHDKLVFVVTEHRKERRLQLELENKKLEIVANNQRRQKHNLLATGGIAISFILSYLLLKFVAYDEIVPVFAGAKPLTWQRCMYLALPVITVLAPAIIIHLWYLKRWGMDHLKSIISFTVGSLWGYSCLVFTDIAYFPAQNTYSTYSDTACMPLIIPLLFFLIDVRKKFGYNVLYVSLLVPVMGIASNLWNLQFIYVVLTFCALGVVTLASVWKRNTHFINKILWSLANPMVVAIVFFLHLGFSPFAVNYNTDPLNTKFNRFRLGVVLVKDCDKYGVVDPWSGEVVIPCVFDIYPDYQKENAFKIVNIKAKYDEPPLNDDLIKNSWLGIVGDTLVYKTTPQLLAELHKKQKVDVKIKINKKNQFIFSGLSETCTVKDSLDNIRNVLDIMKAKTYFEVVHNVINNRQGDSFKKLKWNHLEQLLKYQTAATEFVCRNMRKELDSRDSCDVTISTEDFKSALISNLYLCILKEQVHSSFTHTLEAISLFKLSLINDIAEKNSYHFEGQLNSNNEFFLNDKLIFNEKSSVNGTGFTNKNPHTINEFFRILTTVDQGFHAPFFGKTINGIFDDESIKAISANVMIYNLLRDSVKADSTVTTFEKKVETRQQRVVMEDYYKLLILNMINYICPIIEQRNADNWYVLYDYNLHLLRSALLRLYDIKDINGYNYAKTLIDAGFNRDKDLLHKLDSIDNVLYQQIDLLKETNLFWRRTE